MGFTIVMKMHLTNKVYEVIIKDFRAIHRYFNILISQLTSRNLETF